MRGDAFDNQLSTQFVRGCLVFGHDLAICRSGKCEVVGGGNILVVRGKRQGCMLQMAAHLELFSWCSV